MADPASRRAALYATLVAVPVAILVGVIAFAYIASRTSKSDAKPTASPATAVPSSAVAMSAPKLSPAHAQACLAFIAQLPTQLRNLPERHVTAGPEQNAAFGEPPITVQCGAPSVRPGSHGHSFSDLGRLLVSDDGHHGHGLDHAGSRGSGRGDSAEFVFESRSMGGRVLRSTSQRNAVDQDALPLLTIEATRARSTPTVRTTPTRSAPTGGPGPLESRVQALRELSAGRCRAASRYG